MFRSTLIVSALAALCSAVSLLNQLMLARFFGASEHMDAYLLAVSLPVTISGLVVSVLNFQLLPALQHAKVEAGTHEPLLRALLLGLGFAAVGLALAGSAAARWLVTAQDAQLVPATLVTNLARVAWLWVPLAVIAAIYTAGLHLRQHFVLATLLQIAPMVGTMAFCLFGYSQLGSYAIVWGQFAGYIVMAGGLCLAYGPLRPLKPDWKEFRKLAGKMPLAFASVLVFVIYPFSDAIWGSQVGPSSVSYLGYAQRLLVGISGLAVVGASTVLFPRLAKLAAEGDTIALQDNLAASLRMMLACMVPVTVLVGILALPALQLLFQRGSFRITDAIALARLLPCMFVGMVAMSCMGLLFKALFACQNTRAAANISMICGFTYFVLSGLLCNAWGLKGIGLAYSLSWCLALLLGVRSFWRGKFSQSIVLANARFALHLALGATIVAVIGWSGTHWLPDANSSDQFGRFAVVTTTSLFAAAGYLVAGNTLLGIDEIRLLTKQVLSLARAAR